jgi:hypothetical protein
MKYTAAFETWRTGIWGFDGQGRYGRQTEGEPPTFPHVQVVRGLPDEFADYFDGAIRWYNPAVTDRRVARESWERLLARPPAQRRFKSTWAAFMLGKSWEEEDADKAVGYFQRVRALVAHGFSDPIGLAACSTGLEARAELSRGNTAKAIRLYLEQFATGDTGAMTSLRLVAGKALESEDTLRELSKDELARRIMTAYVACWRGAPWSWDEEKSRSTEFTTRWLTAVEETGVSDVDSAEKLAVAAYQAGRFDLAQRWINRSRSSTISQWLQSKLLLREGRVSQASALLSQVCGSFRLQGPSTNAPESLEDNLFVEVNPAYHDRIPAGRQALGELGVIHLARREFTESLDALLRSGYWVDAAYVAERVLTVDELKSYVENNWESGDSEVEDHQRNWRWSEVPSPSVQRERIRDLLARRLARSHRFAEARLFFAPEGLTNLDALVEALKVGRNESLVSEQRATSLFNAATIVRTNGMELFATEVEPDWAFHGGDYQDGVTAASRTNGGFEIVPATADELSRATAHQANPEKRFHYRYQAASLAWEAASLMPNNSDDTARVLCTAGTWLKLRDPETADIFYKALVRRCRKTAIGDQADTMRWFPVLDENGNPRPWKSPQQNIEPAPEQAVEQAGASSDNFSGVLDDNGITDDVMEVDELESTRLAVDQRTNSPEGHSNGTD